MLSVPIYLVHTSHTMHTTHFFTHAYSPHWYPSGDMFTLTLTTHTHSHFTHTSHTYHTHTHLTLHSGILGETGSSSFNFEHKALIRVPSSSIKTDPLELAIEIGAEDVISVGEDDDETNRSSSATNVQSLTQVEETNAAEGTYSKQADAKTSRQADDGCLKEQGAKETPSEEELNTPPASMSYQFKCDIDDLRQVINSLKENGVECFTTSFEYIPKTYVSLRLDAYNRANKFVDLLCDHEDVVEVYDNFELEEQS